MPVRDDIFNVPESNPDEPFTYQSPAAAPSKKSSYAPNLINNGEVTSTLDDIINAPLTAGTAGKRGGYGTSVTDKELSENQRYNEYSPLINNEDVNAYQQSNLNKAANGILKGVNLVATTVAGSATMVGGLFKWINGGTFNDVFNNEASQALDRWNKQIEDILPNYYTDRERDASWYSPDNWFKTNFLFDKLVKNAGFAVGAIYSGNVFGKGLAMAGSALGSAVGAAANATQKWNQLSKILTHSSRLLSQGKNMEVAAALEKTLLADKSAAGLASFTDELAKIAKTTNTIANVQDKTLRAVMSMYGIGGEASFEAIGAQNEYKEKLVQEFIAKNGVEPSGAELKAMDEASQAVGNSAFVLNSLLLSATQYIQLPKLLGSSYKAERATANAIVSNTDDVTFDATKKAWATAPKSRISSLARKTRYVPFSPIESFEEVSQTAIGVGVEDFYDKKYSGESNDFLTSALNAYIDVVNSKEGGEAFLLGGITGGLMQLKETLKQAREKGILTQGLVADINKSKAISDWMKASVESVARGIALQQEQENATISGDELSAKDLEMDQAINYLMPRIKYGRFDLVKTDFDNYRRLASTEEGFSQLQSSGEAAANDTMTSFTARINKLEATANKIKDIQESLNLRYGGITKDGKKLFDAKVMDSLTYALGKVHDYDGRIPQVLTPLLVKGINVQPIVDKIYAGEDPKKEEYDKVVNDIIALNIPESEVLWEQLDDVIELATRRKKFIDEYESILKAPEEAQEVEQTAKVTPTEVKSVKIKTLRGDSDIDLNEEYFLGYLTRDSKEGKKMRLFPKFTVLGINANGTIKIKDSATGKIANVAADAFKNFNLGKVKDTNKIAEAKFFIRNVNKPLFKRLKGGKVIEGELGYDSKTNQLLFLYTSLKGKPVAEAISLQSFEPKKGYKTGLYYLGKPLTPEDLEDIKKKTYTTEQIIAGRVAIFQELVNEAEENLKSIKSKMDARKSELENTNKKLKELREEVKSPIVPKRGVFRTSTRNAIKAVYQLERVKKNLEDELLSLQDEQRTTESNLEYLYDAIDNVEETSENIYDFVEDLQDNILDLEILKDKIQDEQKAISGLIGKVDAALRTAIKFVYDLIDKFEAKYPEFPTEATSARLKAIQLGVDPETYIGELREFEEQVEQLEVLDITPNERTIKELTEKIDDLSKDFNEIQKEIDAKTVILERFQKKMQEAFRRQELENALKTDIKFKKEFFGNMENELKGQKPPTGDDDGDISKSPNADPRLPSIHIRFRMSTHPSIKPGAEDKRSESVKRFERFTNNYDSFDNELKDQLKVIPITKNNEDALNLTGFIEGTIDTATGFDKSKLTDPDVGIIQMVVIKVTPQGQFFVNEKGEAIGKITDKVPMDQLIHDTLSGTSLTYQSGELAGKNRFTEKDARAKPEEYQAAAKEYRKGMLAKTELTTDDIKNFTLSIGVPEKNIKVVDEKNFYEFNAIDETLTDTDELMNNPQAIKLSTGAPIVVNGYSRTLPTGRPYYQSGSKLEYLHNRNFTIAEAEAIFEVLKAFSKKSLLGKEWDNKLFRYLKGVLYIREPKDGVGTGRNQMYFDFDNGVFVLGKNNVTIPFNLEEGNSKVTKDRFISYLTGVYNNIDSKHLHSEEAFEEFYVENGQLKSRLWKNYRLFLGSSEFVDIEGNKSPRGSKVLLGSSVRKINPAIETDYVFKNKYLIVDETEALYANAEPLVKPEAPKPPVTPKNSTGKLAAKGYTFDGKTVNTYTTKSGEKITFTVGETFESLEVNQDGEVEKAIKRLSEIEDMQIQATELNMSDNDFAFSFLVNSLWDSVLEPALKEASLLKAPQVKKEVSKTSNTVTLNMPKAKEKKVYTTNSGEKITYTEGDSFETFQVDDDAEFKKAVERISKTEGVAEAAKAQGMELKTFSADLIVNSLYDNLNNTEKAEAAKPSKKLRENLDEDEEVFRRVGRFDVQKIDESQWTQFKSWMKANLPQVKFERSKSLIETTDGGAAWGKLQSGLITIYEQAATGTEYHEAFEAVWKYFTPMAEQFKLYKEFVSRVGSFTEHNTGKKIKYSEATLSEAKEELAEEFHKYMYKKLYPPKLKSGLARILNFFVELFNTIKAVFAKPSLIDGMFKQINSGYYRDQVIDKELIADATPEYSRIGSLSAAQVAALNEDITYLLFRQLFKDDISFFALSDNEQSASKLYDEVKRNILETTPVTESEFAELKKKNIKFLRTYGILIDEDSDKVDYERNERSQSDYARDAFRVDVQNSNAAIKLLYATIPKTKFAETGPVKLGETPTTKIKLDINSTYGTHALENRSKLFIQTLQGMYDKSTFTQMISTLADMANTNPAFSVLAKRLKVNVATGTVNFDKLSEDDWRLLINWYSTFSKQQPQGIILYEDEDGDLYSEASDLNTTNQELVNDWVESIKTKGSVIKYVPKEGYKVNKKVLEDLNADKSNRKYIKFLNAFGIKISEALYKTMSPSDKSALDSASATIMAHFAKDLTTISSKTLGIRSSLVRLSTIINKYNNPTFSAIVYGSEDQAKQKFVQHNYLSVFTNVFNNVSTLDELFAMRPELNQMFRANSEVLRKGGEYFDKAGNRTENKLSVGYFDGMVDKPVDKMSYNNRLVSELNMNVKGRYYVLVPADSATEWFLNLGNKYSFSAIQENKSVWNTIFNQFKNYLRDEVNLIENRKTLDLSDEATKKSDKLRFFNEMLSSKTKSKLAKEVDKADFDFDQFYAENEDDIAESIREFIEQEKKKLRQSLVEYHELSPSEGGYSFSRLDKDFAAATFTKGKENLTEEDVNNLMTFFTVNYITNNIEYHKILFGDPANFKDEIKRIKSFLSPRGRTFDLAEYNAWANDKMNKGLQVSDLGYKTYTSHFRTSVVSDFKILPGFLNNKSFKEKFKSLFDKYTKGDIESTDGSAWGSPIFAREFKSRNGEWTPEDEDFFQYDMAKFRWDHKDQLIKAKKYSEKLQQADIKLLDSYRGKEPVKPQEVFKPIVSGVNTKNNTVLHKYSIMPLYYSAVEKNSVGKKMLMKMMVENVDYMIVASGAKVGTKGQHDLFVGTEFNNNPMSNVQEISWEYLGKQVETGYDEKKQTRGSQLTKLATMNLMEEGKPVTEEVGNLISRHDRVLDQMTEFGYAKLLKNLGITENVDAEGFLYFEIPDKVKLQKFFEDVFLPLNPDDNILEMLKLTDGEFAIDFEATNAYQRIKNILLAQVDKTILAPKLNGGPKVQITSLPFNNDGIEFYYFHKGAWKLADGSQPTTAKLVPVSNALKFYEPTDGKTGRMEVMLPVWFRKKLKSSDKLKNLTDDQLLEYINKNAKEVFDGIGFRIPTQELLSVDAFVVKGFLHESMGNTIVVPAELVKKAGSDFDIDKLNTYLKNVYIDNKGDIKVVPYFETKQAAADFLDKIDNKEQFAREPAEFDPSTPILSDEEFGELVDRMYQAGLENEYFDSLGELLLHPLNFERLLTPNTGGQELKDMRDLLVGISQEEFESASQSLLSRDYMSKQRHFFIIGKRGVGIAAVAQTGNALAQRDNVYMDPKKIAKAKLTYENRHLGDGKILLPHNKNSKGYPTLSKIYDKAANLISTKISGYIDGFVDIAKDPFIVQIGVNMKTAGTFLFLERVGVPTKTVVEFMNQPIVRYAFKMVDIAGRSSVTSLSRDDVEYIISQFGGKSADSINPKNFMGNIKKYYGTEGDHLERIAKMTDSEKAEQVKIFEELLKYTTMANHLFKFTMATTYDTARFTDFILFDKKKFATDKQMKDNIFSSPQKVIEGSFLSKIVTALQNSQAALSTILRFERPELKEILDEAKTPFVQNEYVSNDDLTTISNKITGSFVDYLIQTRAVIRSQGKTFTVNQYITSLIKGGKLVKNLDFLKNNPSTEDNLFVNQLTTRINSGDGGKYLAFKNKDNNTDTKNNFIASIQELLESDDITVRGAIKEILMGGILQSGTYKKPFSFNDLIPVENYSNFVKSAMGNINLAEAQEFNNLKAFHRNNWKDKNIVPKISKLHSWETSKGYTRYSMPVMDWQAKGLLEEGLISLSETFNKQELNSPIILVERVKPEFIRNKIARKEMAAKGDFSYMQRTLYQVVMVDGKPLKYRTEYKGNEDVKVVYKKINAWGDGLFLQEYYTSPTQSQIDNGTEKVVEKTDEQIFNAISSKITVVGEQPTEFTDYTVVDNQEDPFKCK